MKFLLKSALALSFVSAAVFAAPVSAESDPNEAIKFRKAVMEVVGGHTVALFAILQQKVPHQDALLYHAEGLAAIAKHAKPAFEQNTAGKGTEETTAKDKVWDGPEFVERLGGLELASANLAAALKSGDGAAIGPAAQELGGACKGCHDKFREEQAH